MKRVIAIFLTLFILLSLSFCVETAATTDAIIVNPSFSASGGWVYKNGASLRTDMGRNDLYSAQIYSTDAQPYVQTYTSMVTAETTYTLSFYIYGETVTSQLECKIEYSNQPVYTPTTRWVELSKSVGAWKRYTLSFKTPDEFSGIFILWRTKAGDKVYLDDVSLAPIGSALVKNGDFENEVQEWIAREGLSAVKGVANNETQVAKLVRNPGSTQSVDLQQNSIAVSPQTAYTLSFWAYAEHVTDTSILGYKIEFSGTTGKQESGLSIADPQKWTQYKVYVTTPENCTSINLLLRLQSAGTLYFDDVVMVPTNHPNVVNGDFSAAGGNGWIRRENVTFGDTLGKDNTGGAKIVSTADNYLQQNGIMVEGGATYKLSFDGFVEQLGDESILSDPSAGQEKKDLVGLHVLGYKMEYIDVHTKNLGKDDYGKLDGRAYRNLWHTYETTFTPPEGATRMNLLLRLYGAGVVRVDNVTITKIKEQALLSIQEYDGLIYADEAKSTVEACVYATPFYLPSANAYAVVSVKNEAGITQYTSDRIRFTNGSCAHTFDTTSFPQEQGYTLFVTLTDGMYSYTAAKEMYKTRRPGMLSESGKIIEDEKRVHPFLAYHVNYNELSRVGELGVNVVQCPYTSSIEGISAYLNQAALYNIYVLVPLYKNMAMAGDEMNAENTKTIAAYFKNRAEYPALLGYIMIDEPYAKFHAPEQTLLKGYRMIREAGDTEHVITLVNDKSLRNADAARYVDVLMIDPYVYAAEAATTTLVAQRTAEAVKAQNKPVWVLIQTSELSGYLPQKADVRSMFYQALESGACGVGYYSIYDYRYVNGKKVSMASNSESAYWNSLAGMKNELLGAYDHFCTGTKISEETVDGVRIVKRKNENGTYIVFMNTDKAEKQASTDHVLYAEQISAQNSGTPYSVSEKKLNVSLAGADVQIYKTYDFCVMQEEKLLTKNEPGRVTVKSDISGRFYMVGYQVDEDGTKELIYMQCSDAGQSIWETAIPENNAADRVKFFVWNAMAPAHNAITVWKD
ncbi:MAG: carbohydrate binding domain-containing protein [Clostridia bacterium]|nr:carbohydrate binding domain-containing protein [Clostridia bacterium]